MQTEIEAKFTNIDKDEIRKKLEKQGAELIHKERLMKRRVFDFPDARLDKIGGWVRVRDEGDKITLSYKQLNDRSLHGTQELTVEVSNFEATCKIFESIGLEQKSYQETRRESWLLDGIEVEIDEWPWIPPFVELEGPSENALKDTALKLGFDWEKAMHGSVETAYQEVYNVTEEEIDRWELIKFAPVPNWLKEQKNNMITKTSTGVSKMKIVDF